MRMTTMKTMPIDRAKFISAITKKGMNMKDLGLKIGRSKGYICQLVRKGLFPPYAVYSVEQAIGIKYEDYKPEENREEPKIEEDESKELKIDEKRLVQPVSELQLTVILNNIAAKIIEPIKSIGNGQDSISVDTTITWHLLKESLEVYQNMNQVLERMDKGQRVQMEHFKKMNENLEQMNENLESILKKTIGLEEVVYKGTKRALNE